MKWKTWSYNWMTRQCVVCGVYSELRSNNFVLVYECKLKIQRPQATVITFAVDLLVIQRVIRQKVFLLFQHSVQQMYGLCALRCWLCYGMSVR